MKGIQFLVDDNNKKTAVQIDLNIYGELWEDFYDALLVELTKNEPTTTFDDFMDELKEEGRLDDADIDYIYSK